MIITALQKINAFLLKTASRFAAFLLEILFPRECLKCGKQGAYFCMDCARELCGKGRVFKGRPPIIACLTYTEHFYLKDVVHHFKYYFAKDLAKPLGLILDHQFKKCFKSDNIVVVPVPLHKKRFRYRSFNQAELLARGITGQNVADILIRTRNTPPQARLSRSERLKNLENAFALKSGTRKLDGKIVILIDDIASTGSTLKECAKALKTARPKEIYGLVIARG